MEFIKDEFDSTQLQINAYKLALHSAVTYNMVADALEKAKNKAFLTCFSPLIEQNVRVLEKLDFHLISIRNTYVYKKNLIPEVYLLERFQIRVFNADKITNSDIAKLAEPIFLVSRYHNDSEIPRKLGRSLYSQWVKNSLFHGYAQKCFIAWEGVVPVGICTVKIKDSDGYIDLLGVLPRYHGKHIGKTLLTHGLVFLYTQDVKNIYVVTESENIQSNIFYQNNAFILNSVDLAYHRHLS